MLPAAKEQPHGGVELQSFPQTAGNLCNHLLRMDGRNDIKCWRPRFHLAKRRRRRKFEELAARGAFVVMTGKTAVLDTEVVLLEALNPAI